VGEVSSSPSPSSVTADLNGVPSFSEDVEPKV